VSASRTRSRPTPLDPVQYRDLVRRALEEDVGAGDRTTEATIPAGSRARGLLVARGACVLAGLDVAVEAFRQLDPAIVVRAAHQDGDAVADGALVAELSGSARALLGAERTALNFLQRLSGIATLTRRFVDRANGRIVVLDTRKTTPTLRALEKYAVAVGGAVNHRMGLFDALLIKENHARLAGGVAAAVVRARAARPSERVEVEAQSLADVDEALAAGADVVLADNLTVDEIRETVRRARGRARVEVSGGVTLERLEPLIAAGADTVSVGALTHSAPAVDISFEIEPL
jgi:nicotinate-nucleotide pyrophosphorylase (carboxylating)